MLAVTLQSEQLAHEADRCNEYIYEVDVILLVGHVRGNVYVCWSDNKMKSRSIPGTSEDPNTPRMSLSRGWQVDHITPSTL